MMTKHQQRNDDKSSTSTASRAVPKYACKCF